MSKWSLYIVACLVTLQSFAQQSFHSWKSEAYNHLDNPKEILKDIRDAGKYVSKNEAKYREDFLALNDTLSMLELHMERRLLLDTIVVRLKKEDVSKSIQAKYLLPLAKSCYSSGQGERAASILHELLEPKYQLVKAKRFECWMLLGNLELNFQFPERAIKKYQKALRELDAKTEKQLPVARSSAYNNIGIAFSQLSNVDSSVYYHQSAFELRKKQGDTFLMGQSLNNIGSMYYEIASYDSALVYYKKGLYYRSITSSASESSLAESWTNIGKTYFRLGDTNKARKELEKSLEYSKRSGNLEIMKRNYEILHELYASEGDTDAAYDALANYYLFRDSLYGIAQTKELLQASYKQELREQALSDSLNQVANQQIYEEKSRKEAVIKYGMGLALLALIVILGLLFRNYRNRIRSSNQISEQKDALEEKNDEIISSITYAKRLQDAILPSKEILLKHLPDPFVMYEPKDIVAGDFYWMHASDSHTYFAVADCTGHGVPGALVSIVCGNALNRATKEFRLTDTGAILDKTTDLVLESFRESGQHVNDGMDVTLIRLGRDTLEKQNVQFSGAFNGLWVITRNPMALKEQLSANQYRELIGSDFSLIEIKANRQPVGYYENRKAFNSINLELEKGDLLYLLTDGFGDQFGGNDLKKYKTSQLKRFLLRIANQSISDQQKVIEQEYERWKGSEEQVDDVCLVGIRLN